MAPPRKENDGEGGVRSIERAIDLLYALAAHGQPMSVLEIQAKVGLSRPTLYRLLQTLAAKNMIRAFGDPQRFSLGAGVMALAHAWSAGIDLVQLARPLLEDLRAETGETAALFVLREDRRLCVLEVVSRYALAISRGVGETEHIAWGASGKAMLAYIPQDSVQWSKIWASLPPEIDPAKLKGELDQARRDGHSVSHGERFQGAMALAAPIFDHTGAVCGSVGLFGPESRFNGGAVDKAAVILKTCADRLSRELGHL